MEVQSLPTKGQPVQTQPTTQSKPTVVETIAIQTHQLSLPISSKEYDGYAQRNFSMRITTKQAKTLQRIQSGLQSSCATLNDGREIRSPIDAIRWMLDRANELMPAQQEQIENRDGEILDL